MKTMDFTISVKNVDADMLNNLWKENMDFMMKNMGEIAEFSNNIEVDFKYAIDVYPQGFMNILAAAFTLQAMKTGIKIVKE
jgi:hypothetical protein